MGLPGHEPSSRVGEEERLRVFLDAIRDYAIFMLDARGFVASWSPGAKALKGYDDAEIIGKHFSVFYPAEDVARGKPEEELRVAAATGRYEDEGWRLRKGGSPFWAHAVITAVRAADGSLIGFVKVTRDLTQRRRIEEARRAEEAKFRALAETAADAIVTADDRGTITFVNPAATAMFGRPAAEVVGLPLTVLMPERFREAHGVSFARVVETGEGRLIGKRLELVGVRPDGAEFPIEMVLSTWDAGGRPAFGAIIRDVTERKRVEGELRDLVRRVEERSRRLEEANADLDGFTYSVSHDLRAPLRAIDGFARVLLEDHGARLDDEGKRVAQIICKNVGKMGELIDDLLSFAKLGRERLNVSRLDMTALVRGAAEEVHDPSRSIEFRIPEVPRAEGDAALIRQVWLNLLGNAVKYTRPRARAVIDVRGEAREREVVYSVEDNGVGFDPQFQNKLFGVFERLHAASEFEGTGVGLALVQRIVRRHGGWVKGEGRPGEGATFSFA